MKRQKRLETKFVPLIGIVLMLIIFAAARKGERALCFQGDSTPVMRINSFI